MLLCLLHKSLCIRKPLLLAFRWHGGSDIFIGVAADTFTIIAIVIVKRTKLTGFPLNDRFIVGGKILIKGDRILAVCMDIIIINNVSESIDHLGCCSVRFGEREGEVMQRVYTF